MRCRDRLKRAVFAAAGAGLVLSFFSCAKEAEGPLIPEGYASWRRTTEEELDYPIPGHEDNYRIIFINDKGENLTVSDAGGRVTHDYPDGTIIVKEVYQGFEYDSNSKPMMLTAMVKDRDNPKSRGGWLWVVKDLSAGQETIMTQEFCFTCHGNANERHPYGDRNPDNEFRDYVFFPAR